MGFDPEWGIVLRRLVEGEGDADGTAGLDLSGEADEAWDNNLSGDGGDGRFLLGDGGDAGGQGEAKACEARFHRMIPPMVF